ncbi:MAG TPA: T9SS type A sorting domain-containing protein, partial [Bacteroidia bacterium]|nr:T9SS type A sorting domain-containing protein [Bacteroidia bacterium]
VFNSGTYSVIVENNCCFATSAGFYVLVHGDNGYNPVSATVDNDTVCPGDSVELSVRTNVRGLIFSKYEEGSGFDKAVEIYNGTGAAVLLSDYEIRNFHNGACDNSIATFTIALPAVMLADGAVFTVANPGHSEIGGCFNPDLQSNDLQFNGDDAVTLYNAAAGEYTDIIGSICNDPGSRWSDTGFYRTQNILLTRRPCVYEGILVNPNLPGTSGFPTLVSEWFRDTIPTACGFGSHNATANLYSWTPQVTVPVSGPVVKALPAGTTTYTVSGAYCDGCPYTDTVRVVVVECPGERQAAPANVAVAAEVAAYPNPFTDNVTLNITTLESGPVKVEIINMLGETVAVLNNSVMAAGTHTITWDGGATLPDGVYSCKVTTGNTVETVMLVKSAK